MALKGYSLEALCFIWEVSVPNINLILESPVFSFDGSQWKFELKVAWNSTCHEDVWTVKIYKVDKTKDCQKFQVRVQVEDKNGEFQFLRIAGVEYPASVELPLLEQTKSSLLRCCSNVRWEGSIKLIFTIHNSIFCTDDLNRKSKFQFDIPDLSPDRLTTPEFTNKVTVSESTKNDKSVQTLSSMNVLPCLESLSADMQKLMDNDSQHDTELRCGDCIFPVHRLIISARSDILKSMIQSDLSENHMYSIQAGDIEFPVLKHFLLYLYTGTLPELTTDIAIKLYKAGDKYAVYSLKKRCCGFLKEYLERNNVFSVLTVGDAYDDANLKEVAIAFILEKELHLEEDEWVTFCDNQPKLANEILNRALKMLKSSKKL